MFLEYFTIHFITQTLDIFGENVRYKTTTVGPLVDGMNPAPVGVYGNYIGYYWEPWKTIHNDNTGIMTG
jgi:hypothetical protein